MALEQKLSLKLAQKLVMTPSLQQAIKLLQMTRLELEGVLTQELVENPMLEESETSEDLSPPRKRNEEAAEEGEKDSASRISTSRPSSVTTPRAGKGLAKLRSSRTVRGPRSRTP